MICENLKTEGGALLFAGQRLEPLAKAYGTPLYLMDAERIRHNCRVYMEAAKASFGENARIYYASKAASFKEIYRIMASEGMYADVVSCGEIATAKAAGFPLEKTCFHSATKTDADIAYAIENGVGLFAVDSTEELIAINSYVQENGAGCGPRVQDVLLRLTPGIDPHTFAAVSTGSVDSKFGFSLLDDTAEKALALALALPFIKLKGFHCHVGSQVFDSDVYIKSADIMIDFIKLAKEKYAFECAVLDLGGGYGVRYKETDPKINIAENIAKLGEHLKEKFSTAGLAMPAICLEPGRSIVADAGLTLYTVGSVKELPGINTYVAIDGGMTDNVRYAMYKAPYTVVAPGNMDAESTMKCTLAGRCCESGDIIQPCVELPKNIKRGDLVAVLTTGAYNYSMSSNYNRLPRPALVMLENGAAKVAVKRESLDDLLINDL